MAEYIDRTELELDTEWSEYEDGFTSYSQFQIQNMPTADVVEREKIDKAIEEIEKEEVEVDYMNERKSGFNSGIFRALEILKRNIGE